MDALFVPLAEATGASIDQIKLISCLLISYPLGSVFIRIPSSRPDLKHLFSIVITLFYFLPVLRMWTGFLQLLASAIGTYVIAANIEDPNMPWIVFAFTMGHLTINHVIRAIYSLSYETAEITGPQMVLTMKLTTFAWNVWDGRRSIEVSIRNWINGSNNHASLSILLYLHFLVMRKPAHLYVETPSESTFVQCSFYFPGILVGPYLTYADYMALITGTLFKAAEKREEDERSSGKHKRLVPKGRKRVAYRKMAIGLAFLGSYVLFGGTYNFGVTIQDWFPRSNFLYRIGYFQICGFFERTKYYAIWTLTEGASILTGLGFTGYAPSGGTRWEGAANVDIWNIEFAPNLKVLLDSWNMKTNVWLRECVYKRVTPKGKKPGFRSSMITFMTSAFWHGISGGYYLTFFFAGFVQTVGRLCRSHLRPLFLPATYVSNRNAPPPPQTPLKRAYDIVGTLYSLLGWSNLHWYGHWIIGGALLFFYGGGTRALRRCQTARMKKAGLKRDKLQADLPGSGTVTPMPRAPTLPPFDEAAREIEQTEFMRSCHSVINRVSTLTVMSRAAAADALPPTARSIALLLASTPTVQDAHPGVLHQLLEFSHRYTAQVLSDALMYAEHAGRTGKIEMDDVVLAVQARVGWEFGGRVPKEYIHSLATQTNSVPLPVVPEVFGVRLPNPSDCLTSVNFDLIPTKPPPGVKLYDEEVEEIEESESEDEDEDMEPAPIPLAAAPISLNQAARSAPVPPTVPIGAVQTPSDVDMMTPAMPVAEEASDAEEEDGLFAGGDEEEEESADEPMEEVAATGPSTVGTNGVKRKLVEEEDYD
ncbi:Lysophospholipid acyltransferase [Grifola frondosa]|uniref:Lysophospholipid acyltransferase n=1 Tax=Grifola frondosa TaxID=5627 RepID=A0A1C7MGR9_GRIFR|nr:Lysophospholipid acyltransferase [Grifola frondosa]